MDNTPNYVDFRRNEQEILASFITGDTRTSVPNAIVSGYKSVGKTHVVLRHLDNLAIRRTVVNCDEFITQKILLQNCLHRIRADSGVDLSTYHQKFTYKGLEAARLSLLCETFAHFLMALEQFVEETGYSEPHVLVLDRFDQCIDHTDDLFRSFVKFREYSTIRNISVVYIISHEEPTQLTTINVPHVRFAPYTLEQVTEIMSKCPFPEVLRGEVDIAFWKKFAKLVVDLFFDYTGSDISLLKDIFQNLWPKFYGLVDPESPNQRDFLDIYRELKDEIVKDEVISNSTVTMYGSGFLEEDASVPLSDLTYHSKFILIAAYLASFTDQKTDTQLFSRLKTSKKRVGSRSPKKSSKNSADAGMSKSNIDARLLSASYFDLERLKAILSVIYRNESSTLSKDNQEYFNLYHELSERDLAKKENEFNTFTLNKSVDVNTQISTLADLGLISRTYSKDPLSTKIRWKCNIGWDVIDGISKEIGFPLSNYSIEE
ncbi:hypothetical protein JCM33374_g5560 [Metschnikowia sp. JCM 33374]|nr:hypothetical protein JCM33374_g5560 [Metschnikowia sp. JCM 33374]